MGGNWIGNKNGEKYKKTYKIKLSLLSTRPTSLYEIARFWLLRKTKESRSRSWSLTVFRLWTLYLFVPKTSLKKLSMKCYQKGRRNKIHQIFHLLFQGHGYFDCTCGRIFKWQSKNCYFWLDQNAVYSTTSQVLSFTDSIITHFTYIWQKLLV